MLNASGMNKEGRSGHELGMILCKKCGSLIATLPTNGVTKIYGVCDKKTCQEHRPAAGSK
ncbi:GapA-binding peptide SR1P [Gordoniibacillus kamchatkensis]|uniref:GapA-binding peptide SR1P n=1 Tax=Gordoniibacillus kamchatkensis TaxID=1590651 RepID=UPI000AE88A5A|nr:GapA-binding peptide SR1P [Paenibacillus sp. VKM B-2647]